MKTSNRFVIIFLIYEVTFVMSREELNDICANYIFESPCMAYETVMFVSEKI